MYTTEFPKINIYSKFMTNITSRVNIINDYVLNNYLQFSPYLIKDGETPESIAFDIYGSTRYWWVILLINNINFNSELWPMSQAYLDEYIENKYGNKKNNIKYYVDDGNITQNVAAKSFKDSNGDIINFYESGEGTGAERGNFIVGRGSPVSFSDYEIMKNEERRKIKILKRDYLESFTNEFNLKIY